MTLTQLSDRINHPLFPGAALAALGFVLLAGAYAFEYLGGLKPCPLCLEQRVPWFILIGLGGALFAAANPASPRHLRLGLCLVAMGVALWGAYLGGYHAGVEYKWWPGPASCTGGSLPTDGPLLGSLSASEIVRCDAVPWALFGVSLAGFNFLFSLLAAAIAASGVRQALGKSA